MTSDDEIHSNACRAYDLLRELDPQLQSLFLWTQAIQKLAHDVRMHTRYDLDEELRALASRLIAEIGLHIWNMVEEAVVPPKEEDEE